MSNTFSLGKRLKLCADFVRTGVKLVDIGTDHGYLPIWLLKNGKILSATAADIGEGPLNTAISNGEKYNVEIKTVLSNGFQNINSDEFDDAVIAGMGGELISEIILNAPFEWQENKRLILQPMTAVPKLRKFLAHNKFEIITEKAVIDEKKIYSVMRVKPAKITFDLSDTEVYMGKIQPSSQFSREYAQKTLSKLKYMLIGAEHRAESDIAESLRETISSIDEIYLQNKM